MPIPADRPLKKWACVGWKRYASNSCMNAALMKVIYISQIVYVHVSGAGRADFLFSVSAQKF